jgi:hypothetical protein
MSTRMNEQPDGRKPLFMAGLVGVLSVANGLAQSSGKSAPRLTLTPAAGQQMQLGWPAAAVACDLELTRKLQTTSEWSRVSQLPLLSNEALSLCVSNTGSNVFYRLRGGRTATVTVLRTPSSSLVPQAVVDGNGALHIVYGLNHNAYYIRSTNNGAAFTAPVKVNSSGTVETEMGERGPKLAVGRDGVIHVVWVDDWAPGVNTYVRYARSLDGGATFQPLQAVSSMSGVDGVTLTADGASNVIAFWHVMVNPTPSEPEATWLHLSRSTNNGASFGSSDKVSISNHNGLACSMCMTRARVGVDGNLYLVFRSATGNMRDFYLLEGSCSSNQFTALRVNQDNWNINYCPMVGPELTFDPYGRALCAFMTSNKVYWAVTDYPITGFRLHVPPPANETNEIFPTATANRRGETLFLWQVGPMSTSGTATVKWARYGIDGAPTGQTGVIGTSFSGTKATAVVGADDNFYIITTAQ